MAATFPAEFALTTALIIVAERGMRVKHDTPLCQAFPHPSIGRIAAKLAIDRRLRAKYNGD